jgi:hypothetical protein
VGEELPDGTGLDGGTVVRLARGHGLAARAGARLAAVPNGLAGAEPLIGDWRAGLGEQALVEQALGEIGAAAEAAGIPVLALKGADLRRRLYGPGERPSNDLDLLVPPERRGEAFALLDRLGFRGATPRDAHQRQHWFATTLRHEERLRLQVDLHWDLAATGRARWQVGEVLGRAVPMDGRSGLLVMGEADLAVHLSLHAVAFHGAVGRWVWWLDLWLLYPELRTGAAALEAHAARIGGRTALEAAKLRVDRLFGGRGESMPASPRARWIAWLAERTEHRAGPGLRRVVAALAVDRPAELVRALSAAARREWAARRSRAG